MEPEDVSLHRHTYDTGWLFGHPSLTVLQGLAEHVPKIQDPALTNGVNIWVLVRNTYGICVVALSLLSFSMGSTLGAK